MSRIALFPAFPHLPASPLFRPFLSPGLILFSAASMALAAPPNFKVVGYMPTYQGDVTAIQYSKLTHVILSFAYPQDDGSLSNVPTAKLNQMAPLAHAAGAKVFLALGGGTNGDKGWLGATKDSASRATLAAACMKAVRDHNLDGIDFDWEYPDGAEQVAAFNATVKLLAAQLHAEGKQISAAVTMTDWPMSFPTKELFAHFDFLNIMIYDNPAPHSTIAHAKSSIEYWIKYRKLPREKFVLGCPFYNSAGQTYRSIVAADPAAANVDTDGNEDYNSLPTIRKKAKLALDSVGGIMFWELSQDATGSLSLLSAVDEVADAYITGIRPGMAPTRGSVRGTQLRFVDGRLILWSGEAARTGTQVPMQGGVLATGRAP